MRPDLWAFDTLQDLTLPSHIWGYLVALFYILITSSLVRNQVRPKKWTGIVAIIIMGVFLSGLFIVYLPNAATLTFASQSEAVVETGIPLFGSVCILLLGGWSGPIAALILGLLSGLVRSLWITGQSLEIFEIGLAAALAAYLMQQNYRGKGFALLRNPIAAGLAGGLVCSLTTLLSTLVSSTFDESWLPAIEYAWYAARNSILPNLVEWIFAGILVKFLLYQVPALRPTQNKLIPPPFAYSSTRRLLYVIVPILIISAIIIIVAITGIAINNALDLTLQQMAYDADLAVDAIPDLELLSAKALSRLASNEELLRIDSQEQQAAMAYFIDLESGLGNASLFKQLVLFRAGAELVNAYPPLNTYDLPLHDDEKTAAELVAGLGHPRTVYVWVAGNNKPILSHVEPIKSNDGAILGALMGRIDLSVALQDVVSALQGTTNSRGFIVDEGNSIIAHPNPGRLMLQWSPPDTNSNQSLDGKFDLAGHAYQDLAPDGSRQLVYYLRDSNRQWTIVVQTPYEQILSAATQVSAPLTVMLVIAGLLLVLILSSFIKRINLPLFNLSQAISMMAEQDLEIPIRIDGEDELARLGKTLEGARQVFQARLNKSQMLFETSQSVASTLDLSQGTPAILDAALQAANADGVRLVAFSDQEQGAATYSAGALARSMAPLDLPIARLLRREHVLRIDNTGRTRAILDVDGLTEQVGAILALPLRNAKGYQGILWVAHRNNHAFLEEEINLLTILAGMASRLVENVQLYQSAESGRRQLAAILSSTNNAIIVTDSQNRIVLLNPAAEAAFGLSAPHALDQLVEEVLDDPALIEMLVGDQSDKTGEILLPNGKVLYGSASSITNDISDGALPVDEQSSGKDDHKQGRVVIFRDITHLKELDDLKTDFVNAVSHDLRNPLTYMRGYVSMLPMVGSLSEKQNEYMDKILNGIDRMSNLVENVLNLAQIESDLDHISEPIQVGKMVKAVADRHQSDAEGKGLEFNLDIMEGQVSILGEPNQLRQAISNLIDNSIKYTRQGSITIRTYSVDDEVIIRIEDTGPGIAPTDQARLFEKFFRIKRRDDSDQKGTGLGLAIVRSIVERRHGGRVWVESQLGVGSSFFIALPKIKG
ncbi:MAG: GAF domain-containing protein [Anaerolineales bacterium]|nr:GAF domain-containing protein [Anaerolineales bacterium]